MAQSAKEGYLKNEIMEIIKPNEIILMYSLT